ncbi:hypothetical protein Godav_025152 [Gossypium davidsonii]|uniref:Uncharacterized protein n=1 Tax=Gossypium davidsonii TaxID=34287 RepID=A0A7J8TE09_GOSDV|nr:hypothetical protein [Gossypium davidsonii]
MPVDERVKADSLDVHSCYLCGSTVIFGKWKNGWQFFKTCKKRTLSGELRGYFRTKFCTGVVILIGSLYLESGELLAMPRY